MPPDSSHRSTGPPRAEAETDSDVVRAAGSRRVWLRRLLVSVAALSLVALAFWYVVIPYPWGLRTNNPERTSLMEQRIREARDRDEAFEIDQQWVGLDQISPRLVRAVLTAEDYRFRQHGGIDWVSLAEEVKWTGDDEFSWGSAEDRAALATALRYVWANRSELRGRSTITQQVAKNLYFGTDRSLARKAMEFVVAKRLEKRLDKDRILELYLNIAEWGPGVFGAEAAARTYFGRSAADLTLDQAAALAGTLPHPLTSNPARNPSRMLWRKNLILRRLDPSTGIPAAPMPMAEPEVDTAGPLPRRELGPDDSLAVGDTLPLDERAIGDTLIRPDTLMAPDALARPDTVPPRDSLPRRDTLPPRDTLSIRHMLPLARSR